MNHLQTLIKHSGFNQSEIAKMIGVSPAQVSQACAGKNNKIAKRVVEFLSYLLEASDAVKDKLLTERELYKRGYDGLLGRHSILVAVLLLGILLYV